MPAPLTRPTRQPAHDLLINLEYKREGRHPFVKMTFAPVGEQDGLNSVGGPFYPRAGEDVFSLILDSRVEQAVLTMGMLDIGVRERIVEGEESTDSAQANEAYGLLAMCVQMNSTAAILAQLGVQVRGTNPFQE